MKYLFIYLISLLIGSSLFAQQSNGITKPTGKVYALVVGISDYEDPSLKLQYADSDAIYFSHFLASKAGGSVPKENIQLLTNASATNGAVYNAIYWLIKTCKKDDYVYFYFSGHGDIENITMFKNAFFICYNSPRVNYTGMALSVDYLNKIAHTLAVQTQAKVILITDACHSGKLTESESVTNQLVGKELLDAQKKEIRIASCQPDQLSNENNHWGNGRGVFSFYLENGLKGLADANADGWVSLGEIKNYLEQRMQDDQLLKQENKKQTPVLIGEDYDFPLFAVDREELITTKAMVHTDSIRNMNLKIVNASPEENDEDLQPEEYFFSLLKDQKLDELTDTLKLYELPAEQIPFAILNILKDNLSTDKEKLKLSQLETQLRSNRDVLKLFNNRLAIAFDDLANDVIKQYLNGDEAELERRRYYNINKNGYDVYPRMFAVALKLTQPDNFYYNIIKVKMHYFTGVSYRLKIPIVKNVDSLITMALIEQEKALALEKNAPNIYNELGILYTYKKNDQKAEAYFIKASQAGRYWSLPLVNLADLYADKGQLSKALIYADSAFKLQPGFRDILLSYGNIYEKKGNWLQAQEAYHQSIKLNSRHFLPFERLGHIYMKTTNYAMADSMFTEAAERKKGYNFEDEINSRNVKLPTFSPPESLICTIDSTTVDNHDLMGYFALGCIYYRDYDLARAETAFKKVIALDNKHPLVYHYLAKVLNEQGRLQECEVVLQLALKNYLNYNDYLKYVDSLVLINKFIFSDNWNCILQCFRGCYYDLDEDYRLLAEIYSTWNNYEAAAYYYRKIIEANPKDSRAYIALSGLFEHTGRYNDAENVLLEYFHQTNGKELDLLTGFYKRATAYYLFNVDWNIKAGNFQYAIAKNDPFSFSNDQKLVDPVDGKIVFANEQVPGIRFPRVEMPRLPFYGQDIRLYKRSMKGKLSPFSDGIAYFKLAAKQVQHDEVMLADIFSKIADLYNWQGLVDSAIYFYEKSVELNQVDVGIKNKLIDLYSFTYRYKDAVILLDTMARKKNISLPKELLLAKYFIEDSRFDEAEKILTKAQNISPIFNPEITELKGKLALFKNELKPAFENYEQLVNLNMHDSINLYNLARISALSGKKTAAWHWLEAALSAGFNYSFVLKFDPYLKLLRKDKYWQIMMIKYKIIGLF